MIITEKRGDIFTTTDKHIIFALNTEGYNDAGFAGQVAERGFSEIVNTGGNRLGDVMEKTIGGITYHGIVCHSLKKGGWQNAPHIIRESLDNMKFQDDASAVLIGSGFIGAIQGAPVKQIYEAFKQSNKNITIWF